MKASDKFSSIKGAYEMASKIAGSIDGTVKDFNDLAHIVAESADVADKELLTQFVKESNNLIHKARKGMSLPVLEKEMNELKKRYGAVSNK